MTTAPSRPSSKSGSASAFELLHEHAIHITALDAGLKSLGHDVAAIRNAQGSVSDKMDKLLEQFNRATPAPSFRDIVLTLVAVGTLVAMIYAGQSYWFRAEFGREAKGLESQIAESRLTEFYERRDLARDIARLQRYVRIKPPFADDATELPYPQMQYQPPAAPVTR